MKRIRRDKNGKENKIRTKHVKKRVQQIMTLKNVDYDTWLNQQHELYLNENMECIDEIIDKEIKRRQNNQGGIQYGK